MVCQVCQRVLLRQAPTTKANEEDDEYEIYHPEHHTSLESLLVAVEDKCFMCCTLWDRVPPKLKRRLRARGDVTNKLTGLITEVRVIIKGYDTHHVSVWLSKPSRRSAQEFCLEPQPLQRWNGTSTIYQDHLQRQLRSKNSSRSLKALLEHWILRCCTQHLKCNQAGPRHGWNPTRLLDISNASNGTIKLVDNRHVTKEVDYVTLSHCWGDGKFLKLNSATRDRLWNGIALGDLPRTFREAVGVARTLGKSYIWIDSLCIVQDAIDFTDWKRESSLMHNVYGHAFCNISATSARDSSEGLFSSRLQSYPVAAKVERATSPNIDGSVAIEDCILVHQDFWDDGVYSAHINTRAWVLQERLLAKRVIHFGEKQIFWECHELDAAETCPDGLPQDLKEWYITGFKSFNPVNKFPRPTGDMNVSVYWALWTWRRIVSSYSRCGLTMPEDKLVALAGIARKMSRILDDEYVVGMWRCTLATGLFWHAMNSGEIYRPAIYRAPTWSWPSVDGHVQAGDIRAEGVRLQVKDYSLEYVTDDPMGAVRSGEIRLVGLIRPFAFDSTDGPVVVNIGDRISPVKEIYLDDVADKVETTSQEGLFYCLEGCHTTTTMGHSMFMLLLRCVDAKNGTFSRIGILKYKLKELPSEFWDTLPRDCANESSYPCVEWDEEKRLHTIRVI